MSIFMPAKLDEQDLAVLKLIDTQKQRLTNIIHANPQRWTGRLARHMQARALQGSNTIEGYDATLNDALAAVDNDAPMDASEETWREIIGYRNAMTYILQLAQDIHFEFHAQLFRSLHFMMLQHSLPKMPGRWRPGEIYVVNQTTNETVYKGPDDQLIPALIDELVDYLNNSQTDSTVVKAAMAHLNLTMIHPFKDGNGRMARALQTLVFARDGILSPVFSSIEEWLGQNVTEYYAVLAQTGQGSWHPENNTHAWIKFCLRAHYQQADTILQRHNRWSLIYQEIHKLLQSRKLNERVGNILLDASLGLRIRATGYRLEQDLSDVIASRDLRRLCDEELLIPYGEKRGRYYTGSQTLLDIAAKFKPSGRGRDPYDIVEKEISTRNSPQLKL
jgi:Fic family protein